MDVEAPRQLPVTVVVARRPRAGHEADLERWAHGVCAGAGRFPGHLGAQVYPPSPPDRTDLVIVFGFGTAAQLAAWEHSPERAQWLQRAEPISEGGQHSPPLQVLAGLFGAAGTPMVPPPRWKSAVVIALSIYPLSLVLALLVSPHLGGLAAPVRTVVTTALVVPMMVWVAVPLVTRALSGWLRPRSSMSRPGPRGSDRAVRDTG